MAGRGIYWIVIQNKLNAGHTFWEIYFMDSPWSSNSAFILFYFQTRRFNIKNL